MMRASVCGRCGHPAPEGEDGRCVSCGFSPETPDVYPASSLYYKHRQVWTAWQMSLLVACVIRGILAPGDPWGHDLLASFVAGLIALGVGQAATLPITLLALQKPVRSTETRSDPLRRLALVGLVPALLVVPIGLLLFVFSSSDSGAGGGSPISGTLGGVVTGLALALVVFATGFTVMWQGGLLVVGAIGLGSALVVVGWVPWRIVRALRS